MPRLRLFDASNTEITFAIGTVQFYTQATLISQGCNATFTRVTDSGNSYSAGTAGSYFGNEGWYGSDPFDRSNGSLLTCCKNTVSQYYNGGNSIKEMVQTAAGGGLKTYYTHRNSTGTQWTFNGTVTGRYTITVGTGSSAITISGSDTTSATYIQMPHLCAFVNNTDLNPIPGRGANIGFYLITKSTSLGEKIGAFTYGSIINDVEYDNEPGEKGFIPTGAYTDSNYPANGGRGTTNKKHPDYASDSVTQPGAPNESEASAVKSGFLNSYLMTQAELDKICSAVYSDTLIDYIKTTFVNPLDFIVSLMVFPTKPVLASAENIKFGKWIAAALSGAAYLGVSVTGTRLANEFKTIDFGTVQIPENWGNFLDYSQTTLELYLPFIGTVNLDVSECMGGSVNVQYTIDFFTGMCVANVLCERSFPLPSGKFIPNRAQHAYQGNCAIQIPLSAVNYGSMVGSLINACTQGITNPVAGFSGIVSDAVSGGLRPNVSSKGNIVANSGFCSVLYPYIRITRPITAEPDSYQEVMGLPSYINTNLGQCDDLCICEEINLEGIVAATSEEITRIRQLCKEGVYV